MEIPWSEEAEMAVLCSALSDNVALAKVMQSLNGTEFMALRNSYIFMAMRDIAMEGGVVDSVTLSDKLRSSNRFDDIGYPYIASLIEAADSPENVEEYINIVRDKYTLRRLLKACDNIQHTIRSQGEGVNATMAMSLAENEIFEITAEAATKNLRGVSGILWETLDAIEQRVSHGGQVPGVPTGFRRLDKMTSGLKPGQLIVIAGRPAMGKTSLALNIALNSAITHNTGVALFSLEMAEGELMERMLCSEGRINSIGVRMGSLKDDEHKRLAEAAGLINTAPIYVNDSAGMTPLEMRSHIVRLSAEQNVGLVIVDYLQLMSLGDHRFTGNRTAEVSKISRDLKVLARDLEVPVIAISQLNRSPESRDNPRPVLSDLRESGSIEQDADVVMFVFREEEYRGTTSKTGENLQGKAELLIRKQRNGPTGKITFDFIGEYTRFEEREHSVHDKVANENREVYGEGAEEVQELSF